ncbi:MAG: M48 family metallopeptidase [Candidatus Brocadiia bacterium]|jgi:heat shock protein HtpX
MWEEIRANRRRSATLILLFVIMLLAIGYAGGTAYQWKRERTAAALRAWGTADPFAAYIPRSEFIGLACTALLALVAAPLAWYWGSGLLLQSAGAHEIEQAESPILFDIVAEMTLAAGLPKPPKVYIIDCDAPNSFSVGTPEDSAIAVTTGLLMRLNRDELQGVIGHEVAHIRNEDARYMTLATALLGMVSLCSFAFLGTGGWGSGQRRPGGGSVGPGDIIGIVSLPFLILSPITARLLYLACSRRRQYLADACSASYTRYPEGLASALEKIAQDRDGMGEASDELAPMFIVNPLAVDGGEGFFSTHPPTADRIRILRSMSGGAGLADYEDAYALRHIEPLLSVAGLAQSARAAARAPSAEPEKPVLARARDAVDIIHRLQGALFIPCACGLKIKVPYDYIAPTITCPICARVMPIPTAAPPAASAAGEISPAAQPAAVPGGPATFRYTPGRWQSFRCACGATVQLSPNLHARRVYCPKCNAETEIVLP